MARACSVCGADDFTRHLVTLYKRVLSDGPCAQPVRLGIHRCDYMPATDAAGRFIGMQQVGAQRARVSRRCRSVAVFFVFLHARVFACTCICV